MAATLETIQTEIEAIQSNLAVQTTKLNNHLSDVEADITTVNTKIRMLNNEDESLHLELHDLANLIDSEDSRLDRIEVKDYQGLIDEVIERIDKDVTLQIVDMDLEHHLELHLLANRIDIHTSKLDKLELKGASVPDHIILSEEEYKDITPEYGKFYFTYEE